MRALLPALLIPFFLASCNSYNLRYKADPQPPGANLFADYTRLQDGVGFPIDTDGRRLEEVYVRKADGSIIRPTGIELPGFGKSGALGTGVGFGSGHVGLGTGLAIPIGPERTNGLTIATFGAAVGEPPWELHVKVQGVQETVIHVNGR